MSDELTGPNRLAAHCADTIPLVEARLSTLTGKKAREARRHLKLMRGLKRWCETRAGYVKPSKAQPDGR